MKGSLFLQRGSKRDLIRPCLEHSIGSGEGAGVDFKDHNIRSGLLVHVCIIRARARIRCTNEKESVNCKRFLLVMLSEND